MSIWMELTSVGFFPRRMQWISNLEAAPSLDFSLRKRTMTVRSAQEVVARVDDWKTLQTRRETFHGKHKGLRLWSLDSDRSRFVFDWLVPAPRDSIDVAVHENHDSQPAYLVRSAFPLVSLRTKVRIERSTPDVDVEAMIGLLAYFWVFFEQERKSH